MDRYFCKKMTCIVSFVLFSYGGIRMEITVYIEIIYIYSCIAAYEGMQATELCTYLLLGV